MGCWGITAFESDAGLDAVDFIRRNLPEDGNLRVRQVIEALKQDDWNRPDNPQDGPSHTSPMALAEIMIKVMDNAPDRLDYDDAWAANDKKFADLASFTADKESIVWLRDYLSDTLNSSRRFAEFGAQKGESYGGWFEEKDWLAWQRHMEQLVRRMDGLLAQDEDEINLLDRQDLSEERSGMEMTMQ